MQGYEFMKSTRRFETRTRFLLLFITALVSVSCGTQSVITGRPPFVYLSGMSLVQDTLSADFDIRNENGLPMNIDRVDITMSVNDVELARKNGSFTLLVDANSTEQVHVESLPDRFKRELLESLEGGEVKSLPFDLKGKVHTLEDGDLSFSHKGYLYPVPGKPGHFRSAVTRSQGLQRDEKI